MDTVAVSGAPNAREPRTLDASPALLRALAYCDRAASVLPVRGRRASRPTLSLAHLERVEEEIGARLHDELLVLLALRDPVARLVTGIRDVLSIAEAAEDHEGPDGYVCVSVVYSEPIAELVEGAHGAAYLSLFAPREPSGAEAEIVVSRDGFLDGAVTTTLAELIDDALHEGLASVEDARSVTRGEAAPLEHAPRLVAGKKKRSAELVRRVAHPKFGVGTVLRRIGDGAESRLVIAFADRERTLLSRFVEALPDATE